MKIPTFGSTGSTLDTTEIDYCAKVLERNIAAWEHVKAEAEKAAAAAGTEEARATHAGSASEATERLARVRAELEAYVPRSGPMFAIGSIPGAKRARIAGFAAQMVQAKSEPDRMEALHRWRCGIVLAAVRGHAGAKGKDGAEIPFDGTYVEHLGQQIPVPTERQVEAYAAAGILPDLAAIAWDLQGLGADGKNG